LDRGMGVHTWGFFDGVSFSAGESGVAWLVLVGEGGGGARDRV
jgi:hypothetical protein